MRFLTRHRLERARNDKRLSLERLRAIRSRLPRLLDAHAGGSFALAPDVPFEVSRRYLPSTNVLATIFRTNVGTVRVIDAMTLPAEGDLSPGRELCRRVEVVSGRVPMRWTVTPRFGYGQDDTRIDERRGFPVATAGNLAIAVNAWDAGRPVVTDASIGARYIAETDAMLGFLADNEYTGPSYKVLNIGAANLLPAYSSELAVPLDNFADAIDRLIEVAARHVLLATGGAGQLYSVTTNPALSTGDGVAMALAAGAAVADLEFMQFHPTALHHPAMPRPLLSEALRGEGARLRDEAGVAFMAGEHPLADLAPRDVVSRAIARRLVDRGLDHLWLDATSIEDFPKRFPTIWAACQDAGLDQHRQTRRRVEPDERRSVKLHGVEDLVVGPQPCLGDGAEAGIGRPHAPQLDLLKQLDNRV